MARHRSDENDATVSLEPVAFDRHAALLADWFRRPHVARWWGDAEDRIDQMRKTPRDEHAVISVGGCPVGYIRWQAVDRAALDAAGLSEIPDGAIDIDILLGEPSWLGRGVGSTALRLLLERLRNQKKGPLAGLCTSIENAVAIQCFEKAGFRKLRQYDDPTYRRCWVFVADL